MSIYLNIEPYCENCNEFEPDVDKNMISAAGDAHYIFHNTIVVCVHADRCRNMKIYLEKEKRCK